MDILNNEFNYDYYDQYAQKGYYDNDLTDKFLIINYLIKKYL